jgi:hypothetical protein
MRELASIACQKHSQAKRGEYQKGLSTSCASVLVLVLLAVVFDKLDKSFLVESDVLGFSGHPDELVLVGNPVIRDGVNQINIRREVNENCSCCKGQDNE